MLHHCFIGIFFNLCKNKLARLLIALGLCRTWLIDSGYTDGEILEINQVSAYFSYANRTVLSLGCNTDGDIIGLSPGNSDDPDDWGHS